MFSDRLIEKISIKNNPTVVGFDTKLEYLPDFIKRKYLDRYGNTIRAATEAILEFNLQIIDSISDIVAVVKPQLAYYEMYGVEGIKLFEKIVLHSKENGLLVIADGKRNDIASTASAYSSAFLGKTVINENLKMPIFDVDALTVNPYLGTDGIEPFLVDCQKYKKGIFVLVKTSNPSSGDFQDLTTNNGKRIVELVAEKVNEWGNSLIGTNGYSSVGGVIGATYPEDAVKLRKILKNAFLLVPGYGSQGGKAEDMAKFFNNDGLGAIINSSRNVLCAYKSEVWKEKYPERDYYMAARDEVIKMRDDINESIKNREL